MKPILYVFVSVFCLLHDFIPLLVGVVGFSFVFFFALLYVQLLCIAITFIIICKQCRLYTLTYTHRLIARLFVSVSMCICAQLQKMKNDSTKTAPFSGAQTNKCREFVYEGFRTIFLFVCFGMNKVKTDIAHSICSCVCVFISLSGSYIHARTMHTQT